MKQQLVWALLFGTRKMECKLNFIKYGEGFGIVRINFIRYREGWRKFTAHVISYIIFDCISDFVVWAAGHLLPTWILQTLLTLASPKCCHSLLTTILMLTWMYSSIFSLPYSFPALFMISLDWFQEIFSWIEPPNNCKMQVHLLGGFEDVSPKVWSQNLYFVNSYSRDVVTCSEA